MGDIEAAAGLLRAARHVLILTGAGVSAESGVPTFREAGRGLWARYDPRQLATPAAFLDDPALVWRWYRWRRDLVASVEPNPGHLAIARLPILLPRLTLVTQNVDGLHQRAGSTEVVEFHGNLFATRCFQCAAPGADDPAVDVPSCTFCGGPLRPGVVWFGEPIPAAALAAADAAARDCDVFLSVGTSALVWPAAGYAESAARRGVAIIEVNPDATPLTGLTHIAVAGKSGEVLPELLDCLGSDC